MAHFFNFQIQKKMEWYLSLSNNVRIELKAMMGGICGVGWQQLTDIGFSYREKIEVLSDKIKQIF